MKKTPTEACVDCCYWTDSGCENPLKKSFKTFKTRGHCILFAAKASEIN